MKAIWILAVFFATGNIINVKNLAKHFYFESKFTEPENYNASGVFHGVLF